MELSATEFEATCPERLDRIDTSRADRIVITKHGRPVAALVPVASSATPAKLHGFLQGGVDIPADFDLTAPTSDEAEFEAAG